MMFDIDQFEERAAIVQFDGGKGRFAAETVAASEQGMERWRAMEIINAERIGHSTGGRDWSAAVDGKRGADDLPGMQRGAEEKNRSMPERDAQAGRDGLALLALRP